MGEISDQIMKGLMCTDCGVCFKKAHGHPVACEHCWKSYAANDPSRPQKAIHPEY